MVCGLLTKREIRMDIDFLQYLKALQRYWWLIVAMVLISIGFGLAYSTSQTPIYEAEMQILASPNLAIGDTGDLIYGLGTIVRNSGITVTSCEIIESQPIREQAARELGVPIDVANQYDVNCVVLPDTTILQTRVQGESPELAADLANALGADGMVYINELYEIVEVQFLGLATPDDNPISPNHMINVAMSAVIGMMGAVGFIILRETLVQFLGQTGKKEDELSSIVEGTIAPISFALMTLNPQIPSQLVNKSRAERRQIQRALAQQVRLFLQENCRAVDTLIYLENKKFVLIMPNTNDEEANRIVADLLAPLRTKVFAVPDTDMTVTYGGLVGIVENEDDVPRWNKVIATCEQVAQEMYSTEMEDAAADPDVVLADVPSA